MLSIEFEPPATDTEPCKCCGGRTTRLARFVYSDGDAYAVYYAQFSDNHPNRYVSVLISIGEWGNDAPPSDRVAVYIRIWTTAENYQVSVRDAVESPWGEVDIFGPTLNRDEALAHPRIKDVFHLSDHIVTDDLPVIEYLSRAAENA
jgi:hypothetical protein